MSKYLVVKVQLEAPLLRTEIGTQDLQNTKNNANYKTL
jgi:hypothetical protein